MSNFREARNIQLSLIYYLETALASSWSGISVFKVFKEVYEKNVSLPIVCVDLAVTSSQRKELGDTELRNTYLLNIYIFAQSDGQRLDIADTIKDAIKDDWVHYDHSKASGNNVDLVRTANGRDHVYNFVTDEKIELLDTFDNKDKYRHMISIEVRTSV